MTENIRGTWCTPPDFFKVVNDEFDFKLDAAASAINTLCGKHYLTDALSETPWPFYGPVWCNPPFKKPMPWMQRCYEEANNLYHPVVMLLPLSCAPWMKFAYDHAAEIRDIYPRIQFLPPPGVKKTSNAKDNVLIVFQPYHHVKCNRYYWRWK